MPTVNEVLKSSGLTDEQIAALDAKVVAGVTQILSTADQTLAAADLAKRSQAEMYDKEIAPALNNWANEKASYDAKMAAYEAALKSAKDGGFNIPDILTKPAEPAAGTRGPDGKFVTGAPGATPGSPTFVADLRKEAGAAIGSMLDLNWKYQSLYGQPMPDSPTSLIAEAQAQRMNPIEYAAKKYDFAGKEKAKKDAEQKAHDDAIRKEASDAKDKEWAEKTGNNPMMRQAETSRFSEVAKAVAKGERKDTMTMTPEARRAYTREQIHKEISANEQQTVN
jgi:hypothetical protein